MEPKHERDVSAAVLRIVATVLVLPLFTLVEAVAFVVHIADMLITSAQGHFVGIELGGFLLTLLECRVSGCTHCPRTST